MSQRVLLKEIWDFQQRRGYPPLPEEVPCLAHTNAARRITRLTALNKKGYVHSYKKYQRGIFLTELGKSLFASKWDVREIPIINNPLAVDMFHHENINDTICVDSRHFLKRKGLLFGVIIRGALFENYHVFDGDIAIVEPCDVFDPGHLALVRWRDRSLIRVCDYRHGQWALATPSPNVEPIALTRQERIEVIGRVVAVYHYRNT